jgi:hypothetical protein
MSVRGGLTSTYRFNVPAAGRIRSNNKAPNGRISSAYYKTQTGSRGNTRVLNLLPTSIQYNGSPLTRIEMQRGSAFLNPNTNIVDRAFSANNSISNSSRLNNDYRRYRGGYVYNFPSYIPYYNEGDQVAWGPSYPWALGNYGYAAYPYPYNKVTDYRVPYPENLDIVPYTGVSENPALYPENLYTTIPYANVGANPVHDVIYNKGFAAPYPLNYGYPNASPECSPYLNCQRYTGPNACRACVSNQGGTNNCATQICGPQVI